MKKFRLYLDQDKEVKWLNEMSENGWACTGYFAGVYTFEECEKGEYLYQEDVATSFFSVSNEYREFMKEAGINIVQVWGPWVILSRETSKGPFEMYTDLDSKIAYYKKVLKIFKIVTIIELILFFIELSVSYKEAGATVIFAVIAGLIVLAFCNITFSTKRKLNRLRAENGEVAVTENGRISRCYSPILLAGNGLYLCSFGIDADKSEIMYGIHLTVLIVACIFMLAGVYLTAKGTSERGE